MNKKLIISILITIFYAVIILICVLHHEVWADEAQVWQLCKYLSISKMFHHLHNEGHPALFYLLVMPFAKLFSNILCMQLICWGGVVCSVFLLLYYSPFKFITKLSIILSAGFIYFFPVIARSYSILPFLIFLAAILYSKRKELPIFYAITIICIASTHIIMFGFCLILFILFLYENFPIKSNKKQIIPSILIILLGLIYVIFQIHDASNSNFYINIDVSGIFIKLKKLLYNFFVNSYNYETVIVNKSFSVKDILLIFIMVISYLYSLISLWIINKKSFLIAFCGIFFQFLIYIIAYGYDLFYVPRICTSLLILIFCYWINETKTTNNKIFNLNIANTALAIFFILTSYNGINYFVKDIKYEFSGSKKTAEFIKKNIKKDDLIYIDNEPYTISVVYYLNNSHELYSVLRDKNLKYVKWDEISYHYFMLEAWKNYAQWQKENFPEKTIYILRAKKNEKGKTLEDLNEHPFEKMFSSPKALDPDEEYTIYKYTEGKN